MEGRLIFDSKERTIVDSVVVGVETTEITPGAVSATSDVNRNHRETWKGQPDSALGRSFAVSTVDCVVRLET